MDPAAEGRRMVTRADFEVIVMLLLGLVLLAATAAFTGLLIADNLSGGPHYTVMVGSDSIATMNMLGVFLAGIALALVFCLGLAMMSAGTARHRRRRAELRSARREAAAVAAERDELAARVETGEEPVGERTVTGGVRPHRHRKHLFGH